MERSGSWTIAQQTWSAVQRIGFPLNGQHCRNEERDLMDSQYFQWNVANELRAIKKGKLGNICENAKERLDTHSHTLATCKSSCRQRLDFNYWPVQWTWGTLQLAAVIEATHTWNSRWLWEMALGAGRRAWASLTCVKVHKELAQVRITIKYAMRSLVACATRRWP